MLISEQQFRKEIHSIKFLEFEWFKYRTNSPQDANNFEFKKDIEIFLKQNKYDKLRKVHKMRLSKKVYLTKKQFLEIEKYKKISCLLKNKVTSTNSFNHL